MFTELVWTKYQFWWKKNYAWLSVDICSDDRCIKNLTNSLFHVVMLSCKLFNNFKAIVSIVLSIVFENLMGGNNILGGSFKRVPPDNPHSRNAPPVTGSMRKISKNVSLAHIWKCSSFCIQIIKQINGLSNGWWKTSVVNMHSSLSIVESLVFRIGLINYKLPCLLPACLVLFVTLFDLIPQDS